VATIFVIAVTPHLAAVADPEDTDAVFPSECGGQEPTVKRGGKLMRDIRQPAKAPDHAATRTVEQIERKIVATGFPGKSPNSNRRAIGRKRHRVQHAFLVIADGRAQDGQ
jgi:hypothetical protein